MVRSFLLFLTILVPLSSFAEASDALQRFQARSMIVAIHQPIISSEIAARIECLPVREGEHFKKDSILVTFNNDLLKAQRDKTKAELEASRLKLENRKKLEQLESIGTLEVALAELEVQRRTAEMQITNILLDRCTIRAPFNGCVVALHVDEHESVGPQQKLLEIVSTDQLEVEVMAPSDWLSWLRKGIPFAVRMDGIQTTIAASVLATGAIVDPVSRMVKVRGSLKKTPNALLPGMTGTVFFQRP